MDVALTRRDQISVANPDEGDLFIDEAGQFVTLADDAIEAEAQAIGIGLSTFVGEWFLDLSVGVPYFEKILGAKGLRHSRLQSILSAEILRRGTLKPTSVLIATVQDSPRVVTVDWQGELLDGTDVSGTTTMNG